MELLLRLEPDARSEPLHAQLERQLREAIRAGRLAAGERVPATRTLAAELGVSRGVVVEAYAQLAAEGYLVTRRGAGTVVAAAARPTRPPRPTPYPRAVPEDFHPGMPDLASFPRGAWLRSLRAVLRDAPHQQLGYADPVGTPQLRETLARYLGRARGVAADGGRVVVTSGLTQGVALACRALRARGARRIAVEDPGFMVHRGVVAHCGLEVVPVPVDGDGLSTDALDALDADVVLVTPAHQMPLGGVLAPARRAELIAWAEARDAYVIEDDYDSEHRYDREPVGALQGLAPERVIYAGCASKVLAPSLRLGWLVLPQALRAALATEKTLDDLGTSALHQLALVDFVERGELDRHLRRMRPRYRARRDALIAALARELPSWRIGAGIAAGLHVVALLPEAVDEAAFLAAAREQGMRLHGLSWFRADPTLPAAPGLVLGFGNASEPSLVRAVAQLAQVAEVVPGALHQPPADAAAAR
ncbi:MAG TPA: PLP-dependent aminotransferase family protein [Conexibacter sp.]|nr:PLP-dependent aminotransferase family protein [Conexibacter sp.]